MNWKERRRRHFNTNKRIIFTWRRRHFSGHVSGNDFKDLDVKNVALIVSVDEHVAPVGDRKRVQNVFQGMQGNGAFLILGLLDSRMEWKVSLPNRRRARKGAGLESDVKVGLQKSDLK